MQFDMFWIHRLLYKQTSVRNQWSRSLLVIRKNAGLGTSALAADEWVYMMTWSESQQSSILIGLISNIKHLQGSVELFIYNEASYLISWSYVFYVKLK